MGDTQAVLDPLDEYPIHQTPAPLTENSLGSNAYDRYFFNGYSDDGSVFFAAALGVYPNRHIIDAAVCVVVDGVQHSVFASDRLGADRRRTSVGPITLDVVEPMSVLTLAVDHPDVAMAATFTARTPPIEEPRFTNHNLSLGVFDYTRYTQFGGWSGTAAVDGSTIDLGGMQGCRDRSWGQRGGRGAEAAPSVPQFFWLWTPINFDDGALHLDVNENADGSRWHDGGFSAPLLTDGDPPWLQPVESMRSVDHHLVLEPGTRWIREATLTFTPWRSDPFEVECTPIMRFQMSGIGYGHHRFRHGTWVGDGVVESERLALADVDPTQIGNFHVQQLVRAHSGDRQGLGVLELLAIGPHQDHQLVGLSDVAPAP